MSSVDEQREMEEQANATSAASVALNNKRRDPSGVETRELKRPRKEKAHDEADSSAHSMIGGVTEEEEEEEVEGKICFLNQVNELKMELKMVTSHLNAEMNRSMEELQKATNEKIQELEAKIITASGQPPAGSDTFALLTDDALLTNIFEFVGVFEYRFVAILNKRFRKLYSEFQKKRIQQAPTDDSSEHFSTSLTSTASVAESIKLAELLVKDMKAGESNHVIKLREREGAGTSYGSFYDVVELRQIRHSPESNWVNFFLRDRVALRYGNLEMLQWLHTNGCRLGNRACAFAARYGHFEILQWLHANGCPWGDYTCIAAADNGHLQVLQWARANGCPWDERTCSFSANNGHLDVLEWARANGCPWDDFTCAFAARNGHLEVLQWLRGNDCPWDELTCAIAASNGHLEVLQWARANGCPWDEGTCAEAASNGHLEVLQWARANGCPWDEVTCAEAASNGHLDVLEWARANGCPE